MPLNQCVQMAPTCALAVLDRIASCPWMYRTTVTPPQSRVAVADAAHACPLEHPHCAGEAYLDIVSRGGSAARGADREVPTKGSLVHPSAEETAGETRGAPVPSGGRPCFVQECDFCCTFSHRDVVCWAVFQTLLELASKKGTETSLVPSEVDPATGAMVFVFTDIMNSTGLLAMCFHRVYCIHCFGI